MVNIKKWETFLISAISLLLTGCDSGNIDDEDILVQNSGKTVKVTATIIGIGQLSDTYTVAVAAFSDDKNMPPHNVRYQKTLQTGNIS
ncbi:MAG: hypothetical protein UE068_12110, partial [Paludibacteraceae bacterium]|nr:hypothetical protein [Paludibacteraceae bacterium]